MTAYYIWLPTSDSTKMRLPEYQKLMHITHSCMQLYTGLEVVILSDNGQSDGCQNEDTDIKSNHFS